MKLYTKILLWFFLNLAVLGLAFYAVFRLQFQFGLDSLLMGQAGERVQAVSDLITSELKATPPTGWNDVLKRFSQAYRAQFFLFSSEGTQAAGEPVSLPDNVLSRVAERHGQFGTGRGPPPGRGPSWAQAPPASETRPKFVQHTANPSRYWIGVSLPILEPQHLRGRPLILLAMSSSLHGGGLFFDLRPWVVVGFAAVLFSLLFWFPLVRGITRSLSQVTQATQQIAEGHFDARLKLRRKDELGQLAHAINTMATRLSGFVTGQKRFLGDIAHELCSPLARIEVALGILEQHADQKQGNYVKDVCEDVQHMSNLVNELLSFSKAGLQPSELKLVPANLAALARQVIDREAAKTSQVELQIDPGLQVLVDPDLLSRALANLVRNAIRYGGDSNLVTIAAKQQLDRVIVSVIDAGPGVPEESLQQIFDPFFRLENSRSRETGGIGLGLAIVKTCVEACQGTVTAHNHEPSGLQVELSLRLAPG